MTADDYEKKIQLIYALWKKCEDPQSKKILVIRGKLLRTAQNKLKDQQKTVLAKTPEELAKPIDNDKVYDVAKMIFG